MGYNDLLLDGTFGDLTPKQEEILHEAGKNSRELLDLITATLDLSRLEAGKVPVQVQAIGVADLIAEIDVETQAQRMKPGVSFVWEVAPQLPPLHTDPVKLKVVLKNLIANAVKFTEEGSVTVRAEACDGGMEFSVSDTGIGMPPEVRSIIFESFRQADGSMARRYGGLGLGLYIVRQVLNVLGGTITLDSEVGRGSTFCVRVPQATPRPAEADSPELGVPSVPG